MKNTKIIIAFVLGISIAVAGSMYAAFNINLKDPSKSGVVAPAPKVQEVRTPDYSNPRDEVEAGPDFDPSNGTECGESCMLKRNDPTEYRLRLIEERLTRLENKK